MLSRIGTTWFILVIISVLLITACTEQVEKENTDSTPVRSIMEESNMLHSGLSGIGGYTYDGEDHQTRFDKHESLPYGVYVPVFMEQRRIEYGTEWTFGSPSSSFAMLDGEEFKPEYVMRDTDKLVFKEYIGSNVEDRMTIDYYSIVDQVNEIIVKLTYETENKDKIQPLLISMIGAIKYVYSHEQFDSGVFITYDEKKLTEIELSTLQVVLANMNAIISKDANTFEDTLESQGLTEALSYFLDEDRLFRFQKLEFIQAVDDKRFNIGIQYRMLTEEGFLIEAIQTYTLRTNQAGEWKIATID